MSSKFPFQHFFDQEKKQTVPVVKDLTINTPTSPTNGAQTSNNYPVSDSDDLNEINNNILQNIQELIPLQKFNAYFENNFFITLLNQSVIEFSVSTPFIKNMIEKHYMQQIEDSIINTLGKNYTVILKIGSNEKSLSSNKYNILNSLEINTDNHSKDRPRTAKEVKFVITSKDVDTSSKINSKTNETSGPLYINIDAVKTFDNFIIGPSNNMACAAAKAVSINPGKLGKYPSLYFYSDSGLGKTHLLHAIANQVKINHPTLSICFVTARDFMKEMINFIQNNKIYDFQKKYSEDIDILMIDDIQELKDKTGTQNEFFHIFNALYNKGKQLLFTSDKPPKEIDGIEERIKTRLQWGLVIDIQKPDLETRIAILKKKAKQLDLYLTDDVINLVACSIKNSIRELEGSLIKLGAYAEVMKVEIDSEMVKDILKLDDISTDKKVTLDSVAKACSQYFRVSLSDLKSKDRSKEISEIRHIAMYLTQKLLGSTLNEIGKYYGGRDHTSVLHAVKKIRDQLQANDSQLSRNLTIIESNL